MNFSESRFEADDDAVARTLAALAHPVRLKLLRCLSESEACCVKDLVGRVGLAQSTVSQHLKVLLEAGLVTYRAERQTSRYGINHHALGSAAASIGTIVAEFCAGGGCCDPQEQSGARDTTANRASCEPDRTD